MRIRGASMDQAFGLVTAAAARSRAALAPMGPPKPMGLKLGAGGSSKAWYQRPIVWIGALGVLAIVYKIVKAKTGPKARAA